MYRFINADGLVSTGQGLLGNNMYAYCNNNPVMYADPTGESGTLAAGATIGGLLKAFVALVVVAVVITVVSDPDFQEGFSGFVDSVVDTISGFFETVSNAIKSITNNKSEETDTPAIDATPNITTEDDDLVIYRYGGTNPSNLTPKEKDRTTGLSFSTVPMPGAAKTTIGELNATGVVYAIKDGDTHVTVRPVDATVDEWIEAGSNSIWTQAVKSAVVKWDG